MLRMQPHLRTNWASLAVAYHLAGKLDEAEQTLAKWEDACKVSQSDNHAEGRAQNALLTYHPPQDVPKHNYEHSEMLLYRASILSEAGKFDQLISYLTSEPTSKYIVDQRASRTYQAQALTELGQLSKAEAMWRQLITENEEDRGFVQGWLRSRGAKVAAAAAAPEDKRQTAEQLKALQADFPKSQAVQRLELDYQTGPAFVEALEVYLSRALTKGVPSIFADLKSLLKDAEKAQAIEKTAVALLQRYSPSTSNDEPPSSYLWTLLFLAQYYSQIGQHQLAMDYIESAIAHTPTLPELYMNKARILKRSGAFEAASHAMEDARLLDGQDRFLNSKDAKYKLRIGDVDGAEKVMGLFTKPDAVSPLADLIEMQAIWFVSEEGRSYETQGQLNLALKRFAQTERIFEDHWDDQLDFHSYCVRKFTMRDYVALCRWEDGIRDRKTYVDSMSRAIDIYLALHDDTTLSDVSKLEARLGNMQVSGPSANGDASTSASKKSAQKASEEQEKKKRRAAEEAAAKAKAKAKANGGEDEEVNNTPPDPDPEGVALLQSADPLAEAKRLVKSLQQYAPQHVATWRAMFEVGLRGRDWLLCGKSLLKLQAIGFPSAEDRSRYAIQRVQFLAGLPDVSSAPEEVSAALKTIVDGVIGGKQTPVADLVEEEYKQSGDILVWARSALALDSEFQKSGKGSAGAAVSGGTLDKIKARVLEYLEEQKSKRTASLHSLLSLRSFLTSSHDVHANPSPRLPASSVSSLSAVVAELDRVAYEMHPLAEAFQSQEIKEQNRSKRSQGRVRWEAAASEEENGAPFDA